MAETPVAQDPRQVILQKIYLKDASVEVPLAPQVFTRPWQPQVDVQVNNSATPLSGDNWHLLLGLTVTAKLGEDVAFLIEVHQAGIFALSGFADPQEKQAVLAGYCASVIFPFARETVCDLVQRAGFPQLLLQPINFDSLYAEHQERAKAEATAGGDSKKH